MNIYVYAQEYVRIYFQMENHYKYKCLRLETEKKIWRALQTTKI